MRQVVPVHTGDRKLKYAINEAMRDCVTNVADTYYMAGSAIGSHPFPTIVRDLQSIVGKEARSQVQLGTACVARPLGSCRGGKTEKGQLSIRLYSHAALFRRWSLHFCSSFIGKA